jgi:hypothetical protein
MNQLESSDNLKRVEKMATIQEEARELFRKKNTDYGDSFATYGPVGVIVRMGDKIQRLISVSSKEVALINNETLRDTLIDLHNYAAMAVMLIDENNENDKKMDSKIIPKSIDIDNFHENIGYY